MIACGRREHETQVKFIRCKSTYFVENDAVPMCDDRSGDVTHVIVIFLCANMNSLVR